MSARAWLDAEQSTVHIIWNNHDIARWRIYMLHQAMMCQLILPIPMPDFLLVVQYYNTTFVRRPCELIPPLQWRHNGRDCVPNHQPRDCLLNRLFRLRSKKTPKLRVTGLCARNSPVPVNSPHKWPVTRKMFPFDDVIMSARYVAEAPGAHTTYLCVIDQFTLSIWVKLR